MVGFFSHRILLNNTNSGYETSLIGEVKFGISAEAEANANGIRNSERGEKVEDKIDFLIKSTLKIRFSITSNK